MNRDIEEEATRGLIQAPRTEIGGSVFLTTNEEPKELAASLSSIKKKKIIKWSIIGGVALILLILAIVLPIVLSNHDKPVPPGPVLPYYNPYVINKEDVKVSPSRITGIIRAPSGYNAQQHINSFNSLLSNLEDDHPLQQLKKGVNSRGIPVGKNNMFTRNLNFTFAQTQWRVSHLVIKDDESDRYSVPTVAVNNPDDNLDMRLDMTGFKFSSDGTFNFAFTDPLLAGNTFINTSDCTLVFMDKFIQMDFNLPSQRLFGLGERIHEFKLQEGAWNMWAHGQPSPYDDGSGRKGGYGVHPFVLIQGKQSDDFFGIYFRNSNAMTPVVKFNDDGTSKLSFITIGGQLEIFFFIHGSAQDVIKKYQDFLGARPKLPPFWALGWMQASYKWTSQEMVENVVSEYKTQGFPLDVVFLDIPYMNNYVDFTVNKTAFKNLSGLANELHANNQHIIPIIDAGISAENLTSNKYYQLGNYIDIFIKSGLYKNETYNNNLINQVWPKIAVFVDWFNPYCSKMWDVGLSDLYKEFEFDGIWIDMNEPWGFQTAELDPADPKFIPITSAPQERKPRFLLNENSDDNYTWYKTFGQDSDSTWYLPFIADFENYQSYDNNSLSLNATNPSMNNSQYNLHSFYGHMMAKRTSEYFKNLDQEDPRKDKRHFILTRSTFTSTGQYASHWLGDNYREYSFMNYSIAGVMNFNMFGISHVGADICGFFGDGRNDKLCAKWAQLGTFYPFARFHYDTYSKPNEPYLMAEPYKSIVKRTMFDRYQYMRLLYTCLYEVSNNGGTCFDPLFYHFPNDNNTYEEIEASFIFAGTLKVTPVLTEADSLTVNSYFPSTNGKWASLNNLGQVLPGNQHHKLDITGQSVNVHLVPGKIISFQNNSDTSINSIHQLINSSISLIVNLDDNDYAKGSLFLDQGESLSELDWNYEYYNFHLSQKTLQVQLQNGHRGSQAGYNLESVKILNAAKYEDSTVACYLSVTNNLKPVGLKVTYLNKEKALLISEAESIVRFHDIHSIHFLTPGELNVCDPQHFKYQIKDGVTPDLKNKSRVDFNLTNIGGALPDITATLRIFEGNILNIKWTWASKSSTGKTPFEVPNEYISTEDKVLQGDLSQFMRILPEPFKIQIMTNDGTPTEVFGLDGMIYDDYLNWIKVHANAEANENFKGIFGLGERASFDFYYKDGVYSMWSKDIPTPIETGDLPAANMYGTHPYFMYKHKQSTWVGVLYKLAAAQDWWIKNSPSTGVVNIQTVAVGGIADIYIMISETPDQVIQKYYSLIGNPVMIPQWGLGWNQCRYGYRDLGVLKGVLDGYRNNDFPLDVMWSDIDYMQNYRNFLYDSELAFKGLPQFITNLHNLGMKYVPILDAGTAARPLPEDNYEEYLDGENKGVFMTINNETFIGQVWPNDAAYPDFFNINGIQWWKDNLSKMHGLIAFDGLWLDMNEASNFCVGACYQRQTVSKPVKSMLKYVPTGRDLEVQSMPLDTQHKNGEISLDTHSLYGIEEIKVTHEWFRDVRKVRTFIIERSSFAGMGKYGSRWLGDNFSEEKFMKLSVSGVMLMSIFGIPLSGADICGFLGDTNENLCIKWHFVGAFYPFSRNHNGGSLAQEPYTWSKPAQDKMREAIKLKYSLVRYYYTNMFDISMNGTGTLYKPLFFEFPEDLQATLDLDYNVMLGSALKLSINSESLNQATTSFYFPAGLWCKLRGNTNGENCFTSIGESKIYPSGLSDYQLHLREGFIVPMQNTTSIQFNTTKDLQNQPVEFNVLGSPSSSGNGKWTAHGRYINDDGETLDHSQNYNSYSLYASYDGSSTITVRIGMDQKALNYNGHLKCYAVNENDMLSGMSFHNAKASNLDSDFSVTITMFFDGSTQKFAATYDAVNDRLHFEVPESAKICLSSIGTIKITKV